jgi:hypothetical protein
MEDDGFIPTLHASSACLLFQTVALLPLIKQRDSLITGWR